MVFVVVEGPFYSINPSAQKNSFFGGRAFNRAKARLWWISFKVGIPQSTDIYVYAWLCRVHMGEPQLPQSGGKDEESGIHGILQYMDLSSVQSDFSGDPSDHDKNFLL